MALQIPIPGCAARPGANRWHPSRMGRGKRRNSGAATLAGSILEASRIPIPGSLRDPGLIADIPPGWVAEKAKLRSCDSCRVDLDGVADPDPRVRCGPRANR